MKKERTLRLPEVVDDDAPEYDFSQDEDEDDDGKFTGWNKDVLKVAGITEEEANEMFADELQNVKI